MNREIFRCPRCRGALRWGAKVVSCEACASEYPLFHGSADFRVSVSPEDKRVEWANNAHLFKDGVEFSKVLREAVVRENPDPEVQEVELQYELGWERRGQRALSRLAYLTRQLGAKPATDTFSCVLDIGCGKGSLLGTFAPMAKQLAGIDYSVECIGYSRALMRERGYPQCALAVSEAEHLPFETGAFDFVSALDAFQKQFTVKHALLSDQRRQMLPAYGAMITDEKSPIYRYAKRAYFILDKEGTVRYVKIQDNPLDLLEPDDVLKALRESGAS